MNPPHHAPQAPVHAPSASPGPIARPLAGGGLVAHAAGMMLVCDASGDVVDHLLQALRTAAERGGQDPGVGRLLIRSVARVLAESMATEMAACAVAGPADGGAAVLVSGTATISVTGGEGELTLGGRTALTWTDRFIQGPVSRIELRLPGAGPADPRCRLDSGVVAGGGLEWLADANVAAARPAPAPAVGRQPRPVQPVQHIPPEGPTDPRRAQPLPVEAPTARGAMPVVHEPEADFRNQPFEAVLLVQPPDAPAPVAPPPPTRTDPEPDARPEVWGGDCKNGHFNDPRAHYCGVCGIAMGQLTIIPRRGPRPPLGVLLMDDGMALRLDTDYVMGRDPERAELITSGKARPARVDDNSGSVSRRHLHVRLHDWDVQLIDQGSVNGTYVMAPGESEYRQIPASQPFQIFPGTMVRLGASRSFRYESHRKR